MIDDKIINEFLKNGVVLLKQIIEPHWILELQKGVEYKFKNPSKYKCVYEELNGDEVFYDDYCNWKRIREYRTFIFNSNLLAIIFLTYPFCYLSGNFS